MSFQIGFVPSTNAVISPIIGEVLLCSKGEVVQKNEVYPRFFPAYSWLDSQLTLLAQVAVLCWAGYNELQRLRPDYAFS